MRRATESHSFPRLRRALFVLGGLAVLGAATGTAVAATARTTFWGEILVNVSGYFAVLALLGLGAFGVAAVSMGGRSWRWPALAFAALGLLVAGYNAAPAAMLYLAPASDARAAATPGAPERALTVASVNIHYENHDRAAFMDWLHDAQPDVLGVLEVTTYWSGVLEQLSDRYPYRTLEPLRDPANPDSFAMQLLSRFPIEESALHQTEHAYRAYLEATIDVAGTDLHVVLAHPTRPGRGWGTHERNAYLLQIADETHWTPTSVWLGDFNATVWSPVYGDMLERSGLADSRAGFGWQPSWRSEKHLAGIWLDLDHILVGGRLTVLERSTGPDVGSDHRPAAAILALPAEPIDHPVRRVGVRTDPAVSG